MRTQIRPLTGIRGVAALWVVTLHLSLLGQDSMTGPLGNVVAHGYLAVDLFFILSGFVMSLSYNDLFASGRSWRRYAVFLIRRTARVYPLYLVVTLVIVALSASGMSHDVSMHGIGARLLFNMALVQSWGFSESLDGPAWSISTEFAAYLLFPLILVAMIRQGWLAAGAAAAVCVCAVVFVSMAPSPWDGPGRSGPLDVHWAYSTWPLVRCLAEFSIGVVIYRAASVPFVRSLAANRPAGYAIVIAIGVLLTLPRTDLLVVGLLVLLVLVLAQGGGASQPRLDCRLWSSWVISLIRSTSCTGSWCG